jgi:S-DNA-T family DNA segregation ATPase FtsK/SpoIIIE
MSRHRALALSEPPRSDDDDDDEGPAPKRARRRPRPEHISTPPRPADDDDVDEARPAARRPGTRPATKKKAAGKKGATKPSGLRDSLPLEVTGIVLFALNVLLVLALVSYTPGDGRPGHAAENWIGPGGAVVADLATIAFGAVAFLLPLGVMVLVVACFRPITRPHHAALRALAGLEAALATMTLLHLVFRGTQAFPFPAGGLIGALIADAGCQVLAPLGTGVVAVAAAFVGVVVALDRPLGGTTRSILDRLTDAWHGATEQLQVWREERRLLAEESARLESAAESLPAVDVAALAAEERERERAEKAEARKARIAEKARARVAERLERDALDAEEARAAAEALKARATATPAPAVVLPLQPRPRGPSSSTPMPADEAAPATLETATVVQSDPPWTKDLQDDPVTSLAEAMERVKKRPVLVADDVLAGVAERAPTMLVDDELKIVEREDDLATLVAEAERLDEEAHIEKAAKREFVLPPLNLLDYDAPALEPIDEGKLRAQADKLTAKFMDFGIEGRVREIRPGPVVTTYEFVPAPGIKVSKIAALSDDIAMAMEAVHVRIVAPIPGKGAVGIEIPNEKRETVYMKEIIADPAFKKKEDKLMMALGKDIEGKSYYANLAEMPHVLISGTTGSGKSVSVNAMICSILYRATPEDVRFMMIDPKMLELSLYDGIPHLLLPPIIDSKKAAVALKWCVAEMERRYQLLSDQGVRDIKGFNEKVAAADAIDDSDPETVRAGLRDKDGKRLTKMPFIVVIIDEYADLIAVAGKDVEGYVMRLAQKARAAGIHVMLATQRPSVDVITGVIKANFPVRMGFRLASSHDSKTIINQPGAEKLLGRGDMLFMPPGTSNVLRVHGAFISEKELHRVVDYLKTQGTPDYNMDILTYQDEGEDGGASAEELANEPKDARYDEALQLVARTKKCSTSYVQRMLNIGYQRAARIVDRMEREGLVGPALNTKGDRDIYLRPDGSVDASQRVNM